MVQCRKVFGRQNIAILSNSAGSSDDKLFREAAACENSLDLPVMRHALKKPNCLGDIEKHFGSCEDLATIAVVGDRLLSDVAMGSQHGMFTILVEPIDPSQDNRVVQAARLLE